MSTLPTDRVRTLAGLVLSVAVFTSAMTDVRLSSSVTLSDGFLLLGTLLVLPQLFRAPIRIPLLLKILLVGVLLVLVGGISSSLSVAVNPFQSLAQLAKLVGAMAVIPLVFHIWRPSRGDLIRISWFWVASAVASVAVGIGEISETYQGRVDGLAQHPNVLGITSVLAIGPAFALALVSRGSQRWAGVLSCLLLTFGMLICGSRAALGGFAVTLLAVVILSKQPRVALIVLISILAGSVLIMSPLVDLPEGNTLARLTASDDPESALQVSESNTARKGLREEAINNVTEQPLTGVGFENAVDAHNIYLQILSSGGIISLTGFLIVAFSILSFPLLHLIGRVQLTNVESAFLILGLGASFAGYLASGIFNNALWERYIWIVPAILLSLIFLAQAEKPMNFSPMTVKDFAPSKASTTINRVG